MNTFEEARINAGITITELSREVKYFTLHHRQDGKG